MEIKYVLLVLIPIITAVISSYLTYYFTIKSKRSEAILKFKEEKYSNLLILLQGFVGRTTSPELKRKFFEEQYKSWLYSSDDVVKAINKMVQLVVDSRGGNDIDPEKGREAVGNIAVEMRKDLLGKTKLAFNDFRYTDVVD
ncbi:MAG: hypothetical protein KAS75_00730 [Planctomycetes bacterium]|nr:hypothetical protein [Planctomycetota bacterium]